MPVCSKRVACRRQAKIERAQIVLDRSQPDLPGSSGSASPVFGRTPNAGLESSGMVLIGILTTEVTKEGQAPSTDSFRQEWLSRT